MNLVNEITYNNITYKVGDVIQAYCGILKDPTSIEPIKIECIDLDTNIILGHTKNGVIRGIKPSLIIKKENYTMKIKKLENHCYLNPSNFKVFINIFKTFLKSIDI